MPVRTYLTFHIPHNVFLTLSTPVVTATASAAALNYWRYSDDATHNMAVITGLLRAANVGSGYDFRRLLTDRIDDQGWWALSVMSTAEYNLPATGIPSIFITQTFMATDGT